MMKITQEPLDKIEANYPGVTETIRRLEEDTFPLCPQCESTDTAKLGIGIVDRTISIAAASSRFKLLPRGPKPGEFYCNSCSNYFDL